MQFFQSFYSLGYSAINLLLIWLVFVVVGYRVLKLQIRGWPAKIIYFAILLSVLIFATNFLADQNKMLNDAIRSEGGLKRTETR